MNLIIHKTFQLVLSLLIDFLDRGLLLTRNLQNEGSLVVKLKSSLRQFCDHHHDLVNRCGMSSVTTDHWYGTLVVITIRLYPPSYLMTGLISRVTIADGCHQWSRSYFPSRTPECTPIFYWFYSIFSFLRFVDHFMYSSFWYFYL